MVIVILNGVEEVVQLRLPNSSTVDRAEIERIILDLLKQLHLPCHSCQVSIHRRRITECSKLGRGKVSLLSSH